MTALPKRLLVIAAHPDDDTIGCGGYMASVARAGGRVVALYVSDGSRSHPDSRAFPPSRLAAVREGEARDALRALGISTEPVFLRFPDGGLATLASGERDAAEIRIAETIRSERPDALLMPWIRDPHPDHVAAAAIALGAVTRAEASDRCGAPGTGVAFYEVWLPVRGSAADAPAADEIDVEEFLFDEDVRAMKRQALYAHRSQTSDLIGDDPCGFRITEDLARVWLAPKERLFRRVKVAHAR